MPLVCIRTRISVAAIVAILAIVALAATGKTRTYTDDGNDSQLLTACLRCCDVVPSSDALLDTQSTNIVAKVMESREFAELHGQTRPSIQLPAWLLLTGLSQSTFKQPSAQVRFCTWLA